MEFRDWRCPHGTLFGRFSAGTLTVTDHNLAEFACSDCKRAVKIADHTVYRVLHRFNVAGELVETVVQRAGYDDRVFVGSEWVEADIRGELRLHER